MTSRAVLKNQPLSGQSGTMSSNPSASSLSPSQLDSMVLDLLNIPDTSERCFTIFQGNPLSRAGKRQQLVKMLATTSFPLIILMGLTATIFSGMLQTHYQMQSVRDIVYLSTEIGNLLHQIQKERDMSSLYVSVIGPESKNRLISQYPQTDLAIANLSSWPSDEKLVKRNADFANREKFQNFINRHRYRLDSDNSTLLNETLYYSGISDVFLNWLIDSVVEIRAEDIWRSIVAYFDLLQSKDSFGMERGLGILYFTRGGFANYDNFLYFLSFQDAAKLSFESARFFSPYVMELYNASFKGNETFFKVITQLRQEVRANDDSIKPSTLRADQWYSSMTEYIDKILEIQRSMGVKIISKLDERINEDIVQLVAIIISFSLVVVLCPVILNAVFALTTAIQSYSLDLAYRTKALSREKKKTDTLLYQLLPRVVAEQLKSSKEVKAEYFAECTLFFSDIVGFTKISARSSPIQVVQMLNSLYSCFDKRLELYDVYKVETIGDAYMVASGLPNRNGKRHSSEVATMSLDLLDNIKLLEIPHLPGTVFQLRIGCHTGPVIAGVVGRKMPRYCLFGVSVTVASKMEALGCPSRIHLSHVCYEALEQIGGFVTTCRNDDVVQNDSVLTNALNGLSKTYWLNDKVGMRRIKPDQLDDNSETNSDVSGYCA